MQVPKAVPGLPSRIYKKNLDIAFLTYESGEMHWPFLQKVQISKKVPVLLKSSAIYEYKCHCDSRYIGKTSHRLEDPIKQHIPKKLIQRHFSSQRPQADRKCKKKTNHSRMRLSHKSTPFRK